MTSRSTRIVALGPLLALLMSLLATTSPAHASGAAARPAAVAAAATTAVSFSSMIKRPPCRMTSAHVQKAALPAHWRAFCVSRIPVRVSLHRPTTFAAARAVGTQWCIALGMRPSTSAGAILSWVASARWCDSRGWAFVVTHA